MGILTKLSGEVLIAQRLAHQYGGGLWEFPGGKVESGENAYAALQREFQEELGVDVLSADPWLQVQYDYSDRVVLLDTWLIKTILGEPSGAEGQEVRWVKPHDFQQYKFPAGSRQIIEKLLGASE